MTSAQPSPLPSAGELGPNLGSDQRPMDARILAPLLGEALQLHGAATVSLTAIPGLWLAAVESEPMADTLIHVRGDDPTWAQALTTLHQVVEESEQAGLRPLAFLFTIAAQLSCEPDFVELRAIEDLLLEIDPAVIYYAGADEESRSPRRLRDYRAYLDDTPMLDAELLVLEL